jgi:hypothetical protein
MRNPTRRNRNIGTPKQGHGQSNKMGIPSPCLVSKSFYERLGKYEKVDKVINGHSFTFVIEETRSSSVHACSIEDLETMLGYIPSSDYGSLKLIILRQPTRKEEITSPVWGRLIYSYEFEDDYHPAIILEAINYEKRLRWKRNLVPDDQKELERLKADGHQFTEDKRNYDCMLQVEHVRNTQLYRTLLHEFGHYVHSCIIDEELYDNIPKDEKEQFAYQYADDLLEKLKQEKLVPFIPSFLHKSPNQKTGV